MTTAPLNVFQRIVRQWDRIHPYNAAQVMRLRGPVDVGGAHESFQRAIDSLGLGIPRLAEGRYHFSPARHQTPLEPLDPARSLSEHLTEQINRPFEEATLPFRPFYLARDDSHYLGIVYQHWIADSVSLRMLMRRWLEYLVDPASAQGRPIDLPRGGYWQTFGPSQSRWFLPEGLLAGPRWFSRFRRVRKVATSGCTNYHMRFAVHRAEDGLIEQVREAAHRRRVTVNDIFLAAIAEACARHLSMQRRPSRQDLGIGTIVDLRPAAQQDLSNTFGLFLGFSNIICRPDSLRDFDRLLASVSMQTQRAKRHHDAAAGMIWLFAALLAGRYLPLDRTFSFYRKHMPLAAGISNVDLTRAWVKEFHPDPLMEYIRASPTGPTVPLAFTPTTIGSTFHLALTHRESVICPNRADAIAGSFLDRLRSLSSARM